MAQLCPTLCQPESQHARPPCPSKTPGVHSNSCPSSGWCHLAISSSVVPFSSCPQLFMYSFSYLEPVCCFTSSSNCCFLTYIQFSQEAGQVVWYSHLFQNFPQFIVIHTVKGFGIVNKAEIDVFLEFSCFFDDCQGPAPVDPGTSKWGQRWRGKTYLFINIRLD